MTFHIRCVHIILVRFQLLSELLWEIAAHSVDHMFSFVILVISRFGFEGWIWVLTATLPDFCILFIYINLRKSLEIKTSLKFSNVLFNLFKIIQYYCTFNSMGTLIAAILAHYLVYNTLTGILKEVMTFWIILKKVYHHSFENGQGL